MIQGLLPVLTGVLLTLNTSCVAAHQPVLENAIGASFEQPNVQTCVYIVQKNDSITTIAGKLYGKEDYWTTLWNDNPEVKDPTQIEIGQKLLVREFAPTKVEDLKPELATRLGVPAYTILHPTEFAYSYSADQSVEIPRVYSTPAPSAPSSLDAVYQAAAAQYGVPWGVIKGLHAIESGYRDGAICNGNGDCGPFQFASGTWAAYHDPNHPNQNSAVDGAYAAARYLATHGNDVQALYEYGTNVQGVLAVAASTGSTY